VGSRLRVAAVGTALLLSRALGGGAAIAGAPASAGPPAPALSAYSAQGADTCLGCHSFDATVMAIFASPHGRPGDPRGPFGHGGLQCEACHGPGGAHVRAFGQKPEGIVVFGPGSPTPKARQNAMCLSCHQRNAAHAWAASEHAANDVTCVDCHKVHAAVDPVRAAATQPDVCGKCHQLQVTDFRKPWHHPVPEGTMSCTSCHEPHGSAAPASLVASTVTRTCTGCHAELRGPFLWEHEPVAENCDDCHTPHGSVQPALLKESPPFLCQQCHEAQGHPSVPQTPQGLPGGMPSPLLLEQSCLNCHSQVHGSNDPSGRELMR
jgi:DmsE family decaheme c-type cytochrome